MKFKKLISGFNSLKTYKTITVQKRTYTSSQKVALQYYWKGQKSKKGEVKKYNFSGEVKNSDPLSFHPLVVLVAPIVP